MKELKVIENELVPVYETSTGEKVVYGTELHAVLEVRSKFADWIKNRINDCEALENEDFQSFSKILEKGGRPQTEYIIKLDIAKEMAMLERNEKGKQVRRYFIQIEKKYKEQTKPQMPQTYLEALKELVAVEEEKERLQLELDRSKDWYSIKRVAALNDVSWKTFDWRKLKQVGEQMGYEVRKIFDANYGEVNTYHREVWETAYPRYEI